LDQFKLRKQNNNDHIIIILNLYLSFKISLSAKTVRNSYKFGLYKKKSARKWAPFLVFIYDVIKNLSRLFQPKKDIIPVRDCFQIEQ
jgi:hypothetical protein